MLTRVATIFGFLFTLVVCLVILSSVCLQPTTAVSRSKSSRSSRQKQTNKGCDILLDSEGLYYVQCANPTKGPGSNKKKCNGCRGKRGPRGHKGKQGSKGRAGAKGSRGPSGFPGRDGNDGSPGFRGAKGAMGPSGRKGDPGNEGPMGPRGYKGRQGESGSAGSPGMPGLPGNCISGTNQLASTAPPVYCVRGQMGLPGSKGESGVPGTIGAKGTKGSKGSTGRPGSRGRKGTQGPPGVFRDFKCNNRYTKWVDANKWNANSPEVSCNRREFLQGFRMERDSSGKPRRHRYKYTCCTIKTRS